MLLKLYDKAMNYLTAISEYKDLSITEELELGYKTAKFSLPYSLVVAEEMKVDIDNYRFVIKEVNMENSDTYEVYCKPYFGGLQRVHIDSLSGNSVELPIALAQALDGTNWTFELEEGLVGTFNLNIQKKTALETVQALAKLYQFEVKFDTLNQILFCYRKRQLHTDMVFISGSNLLNCKSQSDTYDLVTRLIPIGNKGLDISAIHGSSWVENYDYTDEVITAYWIDTSITRPEDLLTAASYKIADLGFPHTSYKIKLTEFIEDLEVGDQVRIIDSIRKIDTVKRVAKIVKYPNYPEKSYVELGTVNTSFDKLYKDLQEAQKIVNDNTLNSINELIKTSGESEEG